ncbi:MAG: substrate-binding domain-containing protein [Chloroflexota bacterium]
MGTASKITISDIARRANVSKSTVSRVLNGTTAVNEKKRTAVLEAVAELNYQPNFMARGLAGGQSLTIGVLTQNITSPHNDHVLRGILMSLRGSKYSPIFADGDWQQEQEQQAIQTLLARQVDGLVIFGGETPDEALCRLAEQTPLVVVGRNIPELPNQCLWIDNFQGAYDATRYLIELGHERIVHITGRLSHIDAFERREGYLQALRDYNIAFDDDLMVEGNFLERSGVMAVETLLLRGRPFSAIFAGNDQMAYGARLAFFRRGIRIPEEISIVGFDDLAGSAYMTPPLTTVRQPAEELGTAAAQALLNMLADKPVDVSPLSASLVVRESVARYR